MMNTAQRSLFGIQLQWVATITLVGIAYWALMSTAAYLTWGAALLGIGPTLGICLGWTQCWLLKSNIPSENWNKWVRFSSAGAALGWFVILVGYFVINVIVVLNVNLLYEMPYYIVPVLPVLAITAGAAVFGYIQWRWGALGKPGALWWALAYAVSWGLGSAIGVLVSEMIVPYRDGILFTGAPNLFIAGVIATLIVSLVTSAVLRRLIIYSDGVWHILDSSLRSE